MENLASSSAFLNVKRILWEDKQGWVRIYINWFLMNDVIGKKIV